MKKLLIVILLAITLLCMLTSCGDDEPVVEVNADGYVVVNGVVTNIVADKDDVISVDADGYIIVNGVKTQYEIAPIIRECEHNLDADGVCKICCEIITDTQGLIYRISNDGTYASVVGYNGTSKRIKIASLYNDLPVTTIADGVFENNKNILSIVIPDSVTTIGDAFAGCTNLISISVGKNVKEIDADFWDCLKLVEVINYSSLNIRIGDEHSYGGIAYYALSVHRGKSNIASYENFLFYADNGINYLIGYENTETDLELPASYKGESYHWIDNLFRGREDITSIIIPDGTTQIPDCAFEDCINLKSVIIPDSVNEIGIGAFSGCSDLASVKIGDGVKSITKNVFSGCNNLTKIVIGKNITSIGECNFANVTDIYYMGSEEEWKNVDYWYSSISPNVIMHYNYTSEE